MDKTNKLFLTGFGVFVLVAIGWIIFDNFNLANWLDSVKWQHWAMLGIVIILIIANTSGKRKENNEAEITENDEEATAKVVQESPNAIEKEDDDRSICPKCEGKNVLRTEDVFSYLDWDEVATYVCGDCNIKYVEKV